MTTRTFLFCFCWVNVLLLPTIQGAEPASTADPRPPNVIVINLDDAGYSDFGFSGRGLFETPRIDALAQSGVICTRGYVTASVCTPSRMGLMTGRYQQRFGAECNVPTVPTPGYTKDDLGLDLDQATLADAMQASGYRTLAVGKWHLGELPKYHPNRRGFDEFYGFLGGSRSYFPLDRPRHATQILSNKEPIDETESFRYTTEVFTEQTLKFIEREKDRPFFVYLAYNAVHGPLHALEEDFDNFPEISPKNRRTLAAMTRAADRGIGQIVDKLNDLNLRGKTLIFLVNDNGGAKLGMVNEPLRGFKGTKWEGGIRVPFALSWPGVLPAETRYDRPVSTLDILPTMLAAAGSEWNPPNPLDGVDLLPFLAGDQTGDPHPYLFWRRWNTGAVMRGDFKLIRVMEDPLKKDRKLILPLALYDLSNDPSETTDVAYQYPDVVEELVDAMAQWEQGLSQPRWRDGKDYEKWDRMRIEEHRIESTGWYGKRSSWKGYPRYDFQVDDLNAFVVLPKRPAAGNPWVWRARFPNFHTGADERLLARGITIAHIDTGGMLGSPRAMEYWDRFYELVTRDHDLSKTMALEAVSRGGLFAYRWAARHPNRVACIYADTPVCDFKSWPLGRGTGLGSKPTWSSLLKEYQLTAAEALAFDENPIDVLGPIANAKIPLLHIVSLNDRVVPPEENTFVLAERYRRLGGEIAIIEVEAGTEKSNGHHFEHPAPKRVADFIEHHLIGQE